MQLGWPITPKVPCAQSEARNFSTAAFSLSLPLLSPQLSHGAVLRNNVHIVECQTLMVLGVSHALRAQCGENLSPLGAWCPHQVGWVLQT